MPDALWASDNDYGIPLLLDALQADALDLPVELWGNTRRSARMGGTWAFYVDDYRFEALMKDPSTVVNTRCVNVIEPNFTTTEQMPMVMALYQIYRKRYLARWWQAHNIRVFVDMNVHPRFYEVNLLGVPEGWRAYATRGYSEQLSALEAEYLLAKKHSGDSEHLLFVVYGGGQAVKRYCQQNGLIHVDEVMNRGA